jgi:hypothetical protein
VEQHKLRFVSVGKPKPPQPFVRQSSTSRDVVVVVRACKRCSYVFCFVPNVYRLWCAAADGQCLVWELLAGQLSASSQLPLARIKESLGTGISRGDLVFDPETNALLVCASERKIR